MATFSIGEIARKAGINASTIRYYERVGLLPEPDRIGGKRRYDLSILDNIRVIQLAQMANLTIQEIHAMLHDFPDDTPPVTRWLRVAASKLPDIQAQIAQLKMAQQILEATADCSCSDFVMCANHLEVASEG